MVAVVPESCDIAGRRGRQTHLVLVAEGCVDISNTETWWSVGKLGYGSG